MRQTARKIVLHGGALPYERLLRSLRFSAETAAGGNALIGENELNGAVRGFGRADHAAAFEPAELAGLEICDDQHLFPD